MSDRSKIEWTNATWSPTLGCTKVSPGCDNCYAIKTVHRLAHNPNPKIHEAAENLTAYRPGHGLMWTGAVRELPDRLDTPLRWRKPRRIFVDSQSDLFHDHVSDEFILQVWKTMARTPQHTYQILTKRPARMRSFVGRLAFAGPTPEERAAGITGRVPYLFSSEEDNASLGPVHPLANVWLGVSVDNQKWANNRIPALLDTPAAVRFLSCEPLLGPVDLSAWMPAGRARWQCSGCRRFYSGDAQEICPGCKRLGYWSGSHVGNGRPNGQPIDWVIVGGESGHGARPMHPAWARGLRDQCLQAGVPFHFKQWGEWGPAPWVVRVCDPAIGWLGTAEELTAAKADAEARGATHVYASWAHEYDHDMYEPIAKPWSVERVDPLDDHQAPMRRWGKQAAGRELDGRTWDQFPAVSP